MTDQPRKDYWRRRKPFEREALLRREPGMSFPCTAERFVAGKLKLTPTRMWEDDVDAVRGGRRYEIRQRRLGDRRPFTRLDLDAFDVLAVCRWTSVRGRRGGVHLILECRLLTSEAIRRAGTAKLNSLLDDVPVRICGKAMTITPREIRAAAITDKATGRPEESVGRA